MSGGTWAKAQAGPQIVGDSYRVGMDIRAPYTDENIQGVEDTWRALAGVDGNVTTKSVTVHFPNRQTGIWRAEVEYVPRVGGFTIDQLGTFCQDVVANVVSSLALVATTVEHFVATTVADVGTGLGKGIGAIVTPLNPALIVVGVVAVIFLFREARL